MFEKWLISLLFLAVVAALLFLWFKRRPGKPVSVPTTETDSWETIETEVAKTPRIQVKSETLSQTAPPPATKEEQDRFDLPAGFMEALATQTYEQAAPSENAHDEKNDASPSSASAPERIEATPVAMGSESVAEAPTPTAMTEAKAAAAAEPDTDTTITDTADVEDAAGEETTDTDDLQPEPAPAPGPASQRSTDGKTIAATDQPRILELEVPQKGPLPVIKAFNPETERLVLRYDGPEANDVVMLPTIYNTFQIALGGRPVIQLECPAGAEALKSALEITPTEPAASRS